MTVDVALVSGISTEAEEAARQAGLSGLEQTLVLMSRKMLMVA